MNLVEGLMSILMGIELIFRGLSAIYLYGPLILIAYAIFRLCQNWWGSRMTKTASSETATLSELSVETPPQTLAVPPQTLLSTTDFEAASWDGYLDAKIAVLFSILLKYGMPFEHGAQYYEWLGAPVVDFGFSAWTISIVSRRWVLLPGYSFRSQPRLSHNAFSRKFAEELPASNLDLAVIASEVGTCDGTASVRLATGTWIADPGMGCWRPAKNHDLFSPLGINDFDDDFPALPPVTTDMLESNERHYLHKQELQFYNWERRAAVVEADSFAFFQQRGGSHWQRADTLDVIHTGNPMAMGTFIEVFSDLPPLPRARPRV